MSRLRAGTGSSVLEDAAAAGREAAGAAIAALDGEQPALILVYASVRYDLAVLLAAIRESTGSTPLIGASSCGHFAEGMMAGPGEGAAVLAMTGGGYRFGVASVTGLATDSFAAGRALARAAREAAGAGPGRHAALILLADGLSGDPQQLLNGLYRVTGAAVPVVGGAAGDDQRLTQTFVLHDDQVLTDAAAAVWVDSDHPLHVGCGHGWEPISLPMMVTQSDGLILEKIAGRPATDVYREHVHGDTPQRDSVIGAGTWYSSHALGLIEPDGTQLIRGCYFDGEGRLKTFTPLPPYAAIQMVSAGPDALLAVTEPLVEAAVTGHEPGVLLAFSCVARYDILADRAGEEPDRLQKAARQIPTFGFHTYGEFARTAGVAGVHNSSLAVIAL